jgi:hypothetical protein
MSAILIVEVKQRTADGTQSRSLGFVTDDFLADQLIESLYNQIRQRSLDINFEPDMWVDTTLRDEIATLGWDIWSVNNRNGPTSVFYKVPARLWNQVPSSVANFTLTMSGDVSF